MRGLHWLLVLLFSCFVSLRQSNMLDTVLHGRVVTVLHGRVVTVLAMMLDVVTVLYVRVVTELAMMLDVMIVI